MRITVSKSLYLKRVLGSRWNTSLRALLEAPCVSEGLFRSVFWQKYSNPTILKSPCVVFRWNARREILEVVMTMGADIGLFHWNSTCLWVLVFTTICLHLEVQDRWIFWKYTTTVYGGCRALQDKRQKIKFWASSPTMVCSKHVIGKLWRILSVWKIEQHEMYGFIGLVLKTKYIKVFGVISGASKRRESEISQAPEKLLKRVKCI